MADAIQLIMNDKQLLDRLSSNAIATVQKNDWKVIVNKYEEAYSSLLSK